MKRSTFAFTAASAILLGSIASAQGTPPNPNRENDIAGCVDANLGAGFDGFLYVYNDPSVGDAAGTQATIALATDDEDWAWKVYPKERLNYCANSAEISGLTFFSYDFDFNVTDGGINGFNAAIADLIFTVGNGGVGSVVPGNIEPDLTDPNGVLVQFGPSDVNNNTALPAPPCPPVGFLYGYGFDAAIGTGAGDGIIIVADGTEDLVQTQVIPGAGHTFSGGNSCGDPNAGTGSLVDLHSGCGLGGIGETPFDLLGGVSPYGGFGIAGAIFGQDATCEIAVASIQLFQPTMTTRMDSAVGNPIEEGLAAVHYDCPPGTGGSLGARMYAWEAIGESGAIIPSLALIPAGGCAPFLGGQTGINLAGPLTGIFLNLWQIPIVQADNDAAATATVFDDGVGNALQLPLPAQLIPVGVTIPLHFQGWWRAFPGDPLRNTNVHTMFLHG